MNKEKIYNKLTETILNMYTMYKGLPIFILDPVAFGICVKLYKTDLKNEIYKVWFRTVMNINKELNLEWLDPMNLNYLKRRCKKHFDKYQTYLTSLETQIRNSGVGKTSIIVDDSVRLPLKPQKLKDVNSFELFGGTVYKYYQKEEDTTLEVYTKSDFKHPDEINKLQFISGFGSIKWIITNNLLETNERFNWLQGMIPSLTTEVIDVDINVSDDYSTINTLKVKVTYNYGELDEISSTNYLNIDFNYVMKIMNIIKQSDLRNCKILIKDNNVKYINKNDVIEEQNEVKLKDVITNLIITTKQTDNLSLTVPYNITSLLLTILGVYEGRIPTDILMKVEKMKNITEDSTIKPKIVISGGKGSGKTTLIKSMNMSEFVIDSDDWGCWIDYFMHENGMSDLEIKDEGIVTDDKIFNSVLEWYAKKNEFNISFFNKFALNHVKKSLLWDYLLSVEQQELNQSKFLDLLLDLVTSFNDLMGQLHQELLNHKYLSIRMFELGLMKTEDYGNAEYCIQFIHLPVESNYNIIHQVFCQFEPILNPDVSILLRWQNMEELNNENKLVKYISDMCLKWYYQEKNEIRELKLTIFYVAYLLKQVRDFDLSIIFDHFTPGMGRTYRPG